MDYPWKGNVRELENAVERAMIFCDSDILTMQHFTQISSENSPSRNLNDDLKSSVRRFEQERIFKALKAAGNDKSKAAEVLGLSLSSLYRKMSELGIELKN